MECLFLFVFSLWSTNPRLFVWSSSLPLSMASSFTKNWPQTILHLRSMVLNSSKCTNGIRYGVPHSTNTSTGGWVTLYKLPAALCRVNICAGTPIVVGHDRAMVNTWWPSFFYSQFMYTLIPIACTFSTSRMTNSILLCHVLTPSNPFYINVYLYHIYAVDGFP